MVETATARQAGEMQQLPELRNLVERGHPHDDQLKAQQGLCSGQYHAALNEYLLDARGEIGLLLLTHINLSQRIEMAAMQ